MKLRQCINQSLHFCCILACLAFATTARASENHGQVTYNSLPVPGVTVTATQEGKKFSVVTDQQGYYSFADLADGKWKLQIEMTGFSSMDQDITVAPKAPAAKWELKLMSLDEIRAATKAIKVAPTPLVAPAPTADNKNQPAKPQQNTPPTQSADQQKAEDGLLVNGSVNNAATSQYSLAQGFGNTRSGGKGLYTGFLNFNFNNSSLNARTYSLTGQDTPKLPYNQVTTGILIGGPLKIPHLIPLFRAPTFTLGYQWTRNTLDQTDSVLVPTTAERSGNFTAAGLPAIYNNQPYNAACGVATGTQFSYLGVANVIPPGCIASQATSLLNYYPKPNFVGSTIYNYQIPVQSSMHQDNIFLRLDKSIGHKDNVYGNYSYQSTRSANPSVLGFLDTTDILGQVGYAAWNHQFSRGLNVTTRYDYSRLTTKLTPNFANRINVSGLAGIPNAITSPNSGGNDQDPADWAPPTLSFVSFQSLSDVPSENNRNQTVKYSSVANWYHGHHNVSGGGDLRRQEFNYYQQLNPQGTYAFTGAATASPSATGADFADFLTGTPDTANISYGNPDKYFRESVYDLFLNDDWRLRPELTLNAGIRWEYSAPITELKNRLVNLDVTSGFAAETPVVASNPIGALTGQKYPTSLVRPDKHDIEPRIGLAWRPISGSSLVVRPSYGLYADTSVYQSTALKLATQEPLPSPSKSLSVQNSAACPLTLAAGFLPCSGTTADTFGIDPNFRIGTAQVWQLQVQRDLPGALVMIATYTGTKGTHGVQQFLPNTYPIGETSPCPSCPVGFVYQTSTGNSTRESGQLQLRRRLRSGLTASATYTYSKSIDDDSALGGQGPVAAGGTSQAAAGENIAQNWLNLKGERGLSSFDQRNLLNLYAQYTTGMGLSGGTLMSGWRGALYKEWTFATTIVAGSGLPETPIYLATVPGTGTTGTIRAQVTGASVTAAPAGLYLNPAAFTTPASGQWGNAAKDSITGPGQFSMNASMLRTFRLKAKYNLDFHIDATNLLNHATTTSYYSTINSSQFGARASVNAMRSFQTTLRLRF
jgi:hypothetical protein